MTIGPLQLETWHLALIAVALIALLWFLGGFLVPVTGTWERVDEDLKTGAVERITLVQFGPIVRGRRIMRGGFQEFSGFLSGRSVSLVRRDHGLAMIVGQGFPEPIAKAIDGTVTARLRMTVSADGKAIHGTFEPQKIEFTHQPPSVTSRRFLEPTFRRYKLVSRSPTETEIVETSPPSRDPTPPKVRRTI